VYSYDTVSPLNLEYGWFTNAKNAVKHRIASYKNRVSICRLSVFGKLLTSERFQIGCECAASKEAEAENLYKWLMKIGYYTASRALGTKRALASDHNDE
jgi:hypothetical protein